MLPNFLIIGAPRCGTSWLARNLRMHPQAYLPHEKEIHFFDKKYNNGIVWYEKHFNDRSEVAVGEATPDYLNNAMIPELIHKILPNAKLIASLRDPVERAYSHYWYRVADNKVRGKVVSFEQQINKNYRLIKDGLYGESLQRYYNLFPEENILILRYEDIKFVPDKLMRTVFGFLGIDENFKSPIIKKIINSSATRSRSRFIHSFSRKISKLGLNRTSDAIDIFSRKDIPPLNDKVRKQLIEEYFIDDINKIEKLITQDLTSWKQ